MTARIGFVVPRFNPVVVPLGEHTHAKKACPQPRTPTAFHSRTHSANF
jgi:hypothetical protein